MKSFISALVFVLVLANVGHATTLSGKVAFKGTAPSAKPIKMNADPKCAEANKDKKPVSEDVVVNSNGTLQNVFVYVKEGLTQKDFQASTEPMVVFDQNGCRYHPHVFGIRTNQTLEIRNSDPTLHNVHALPKTNSQFNVGMPIKDMKISKKFEKPEIGAKIKCDVHPWMKAYVHIMDHPFYSVTGEQGSFEIKDLPAGKYVVSAWHETYGTKDVSVTVEEGKPTSVSFDFSSTDKK